MKQYQLWLISFTLLLLLSFQVDAQTKKKTKKPVQKTQTQKKAPPKKSTPVQKKPEVKAAPPERKPVNATEDEKRVRDIIAFLQYMLNTLGSSSTSVRDKDVLVTQSYSKIFRDGKVQIEDDLDAERVVITNKDIIPYLKDVQFFFKDVKFEFAIEDIKSSTMPGGEIFYKVSARRTLTGTTTDGDPVNNTISRFIEINYDPANQDLRIVSLYTHEINEKAVLANWWYDLSPEWKNILIKKIPGKSPADSLAIGDIKMITAIQDLDISKNVFIQNLDPLERVNNLKTLNLSGTNISDLSPVRNLTELETMNISHSRATDLTPLKYSNKLVRLDISHTSISDITVFEKMPALQDLNMSTTSVTDFTPISLLAELQKVNLAFTKILDLTPFEGLTKITSLDLSGSSVLDIGPLRNLKQLETLDLDSTRISTVESIRGLENLKVLRVNNTTLSDLSPLQKLVNLEKIYADHTRIDQIAADKFHAANEKTKVIFDSDNLMAWWNTLTSQWQTVFSNTVKSSIDPSKEELASISEIDSVNIKDLHINDLEPLRKLLKLKAVVATNTTIRDLSPLEAHEHMRYLDISETEISDLSTINKFTKLKVLRADRSKIENIEKLTAPSLILFYADQTSVHDITAREFLEKNPKCLLIYKTVHLNRWWNNLPENWKNVFRAQMGTDTTRENYHKLVEQQAFHFKDAPVADLNAFSEFVQLKELHFSGTSITTIPKLENLQALTSLHATNSPVQNIELPGLPTTLTDLDISNTPIDDLKNIGILVNLKKLNCAGTQIKRLDHLIQSPGLESIDCSNTNVSKLDVLDVLSLKTLTCYNTKISNRTIENFKAKHPECNVVYYR